MSLQLPLGLSEREYQVALLIMRGHTNREIAGRLGITEETVKCHVSKALVTTGARDRTQLAMKVWWETEGKAKARGIRGWG